MAEPTLFDEASLALIASGGAGKDGKVYSVKPVPVYGAEQITNGGFTTDLSGWTINNANAANTVEWSAGQAHLKRTASTATELQQVALVVGKKYYVNVVVNNIGDAAGAAAQYNGSTRFIFSQGINSFEFIANNVLFSLICLSNTTEYYIDNVSIKEIIVEDGDFTFTRGSNLSATRVNSSQLIEKGRENLLLQSNNFTESSVWFPSAMLSITANQAGYDGSNNAFIAIPTTQQTGHNLRQPGTTFNGIQTYSLYVKSAGYYPQLRATGIGGTTMWVTYNLDNGTIGNSGGGQIDAQITSVGNGWYRCSMFFIGSGQPYFGLYIAETGTANEAPPFAADGTSGLYIQDAQLETSLVATPYIETGALTAQAGILENTPRFDYSGGATCPSLLLEPSRSNLMSYSEYFGTYNALNGSSITSNYSVSPEGYNNATRLELNSQNKSGIELIAAGTSVANKNHTVSCYVKSNGADTEFRLKCTHSAVVDYFSNNLTATSEWQRFTFTQLFGAGANNAINAGISNSTTNNAADLSIYGFQLEQNSSYPTSYIPTYGVSQTRAGEACGDAGDAATFNSTEGVLYAEIAALVNGDVDRSIVLSDGTTSNYLRITLHANSNRIAFFSSANVNYNNFDFSQTDNLKIAFQYKANDWKVYINGILKTQLSALTFSPNTLSDLSFSLANTSPFYGKTKQVLVFNEALSDTELIKLTTI